MIPRGLKSKILSAIPLDQVERLIEHLLAGGVSVEEIADEVVAILDDLVDWSKLIPGPIGAALDAADSPILRLVVHLLIGAVQARRS